MGLYCLLLTLAAFQKGLMEIAPKLHPPTFRWPTIFPEFTEPLIVERDTEVPATLCIIEFTESYKVNLYKDYGHFQLKMTENGLLALVLKKSLEGELTNNYILVVAARNEQGKEDSLEIGILVKDDHEEEKDLAPKIENENNVTSISVGLAVAFGVLLLVLCITLRWRKHGDRSHEADHTVKGLCLNSRGKQDITITWTRSKKWKRSHHYIIQYKRYMKLTDEWQSGVSKKEVFTVTNLDPGTQYFFKVAVWTSEGLSRYSNVLAVKTLGCHKNLQAHLAKPEILETEL
ncbi:uncharacterized protein LOC136038568 isoform X2 [Artemia franciscana]|uniref:uncharacterized protein LOC136038568 isoform X2 n=1 Tax=Artemia franciscana TaxID=6661 RepID=UPI0032DBEBF9